MIDLCVVSFQTRDKLQRLIDGLYADDGSDVWNLFVADNGSTDGSVEYLQQCDGFQAFYNHNIGYASACNQLALQGTGDIIGLLNADVWLDTHDLQEVQRRFDDTSVAILGPKQRNEQGKITHGGIFGTNQDPTHRGWLQADVHDELYRDVRDAVTVSGSAYFVRRSVWNTLANCAIYRSLHLVQQNPYKGAFLPTPHYYEETFCSYHATAHGLRVVYDGTISIGHSWHASSPVGSEPDRMFNRSRDLFREACDVHGITHD